MDPLIAEISQRPKLYEEGYVDTEEDGEMPMEERDLAEDAQWKIFQKNTFTRWANEHLKQAKTSVNDIQTDFSDGLRLISLVEVLSGNKFARYSKRPNFRTQKLENVTMVLKFLEDTEGLKLVNIDSTDIVDSRLKLILGLIWALILHYSISMPMWEGEEELPQDDKGKGPTPKQRIISWVNSKMPDLPVRNLTTDWNSGVAIGALVDACAPGLCPDWDTWGNRKPLDNATEAMTAAEQWLDVPQLLRPEEMIDKKVDEKAMMTYLSQFPNAKLKEGAPLRPKINPARVRAFGPGLEQTGNTIGTPARFTVETFSAGRANMEVIVLTAGGVKIPCEIVKNEDRNLTYSCTYIPKTEGQYRIIIKYSSTEIPNSPFLVNVEGSPGDPLKVSCSGPGVEENGGNAVGRRTFFNAFTMDAGAGTIACDIVDPSGRKDTIKPRVTRPDSNGPYLIEYTPKTDGLHNVHVYFAGQPISRSPFTVKIGPLATVAALQTAQAIKAQQPARSGQSNQIAVASLTGKVNPDNLGPASGVNVATIIPAVGGPVSSNQQPHAFLARLPVQQNQIVQEQPTSGAGTAGVSLLNSVTNSSAQNVEDGGVVIAELSAQAPKQQQLFVPMSDVISSPPKKACIPTLAYATGKGVQESGIRAQDVVSFQVHTENAGEGDLAVNLRRADGQLEAVKIDRISQYVYECSYTPQRPGQYTLNVLYGDGYITNSPFKIVVGPYKQSSIRAFGPGLHNGVIQQPNHFTVVSNNENGALGFLVVGQSEAEINCTDNRDGSAFVRYTVPEPGEYAIHITCDEEDIQNSPFMANIIESSEIDVTKVKVFGPGISQNPSAVVNGKPTELFIDLEAVMPQVSALAMKLNCLPINLINVECHDSLGEKIPVDVIQVNASRYKFTYTPKNIGIVTVDMAVAGIGLPETGTRVPVGSDLNVSALKIFGSGLETAPLRQTSSFTVDLRDAFPILHDRKEALKELQIHITGEKGEIVRPRVMENSDGTLKVEYVPPETTSAICVSVILFDQQVGQSPYCVPVTPGYDVSKVTVSGLDSPVSAMTAQQFKIHTGDVGIPQKEPTVVIKSTSVATQLPVKVAKIPEGYSASYTLPEPGQYACMVKDGEFPLSGPYCIEAIPTGQTVPPNTVKSATKFVPTPIPGRPTNPLIAAHNDALNQPGVLPKPIPLHSGTVVPLQIVSPQLVSPVKQTSVSGPLQTPIKPITQPSAPEAAIVPPITTTPQRVNSGVVNPYADPLLQGPGKEGIPRPPILSEDKERAIKTSMWPQSQPGQPADKVNAYGPGLEKAMATIPAEFIIDSTDSTPGRFGVTMEGPQQPKVVCTDNGNKTIGVSYVVPVPGTYKINVLYNGDTHIRGSPFLVHAYPVGKMDLNVDKITAYGPGLRPDGVFNESISKFIVDATEIEKVGAEEVTAVIRGPDNHSYTCDVKNNHDGTYLVTYSATVEGLNKIDVAYGGVPIPSSPFTVDVVPGFDASRVRAFGPGLEPSGPYLVPNLTTSFTVDMTGAGKGNLGLSIEGPGDAGIECIDNLNGTCTVEYTPAVAGIFHITIRFNEVEIPLSPFQVRVQGGSDISKVRCYGPGLEPGKVRATCPAKFIADTTQIGDVPIEVTYTPSQGSSPVPVPVHPIPGQPGLSECTYIPKVEGPCEISVTCDGKPVIGSPFVIPVRPTTEPERIRITGAGITGPVQASLPSVFTVDTREAGSGNLTLDLQDPVGHSLPVNVIPITAEALELKSPYNLNELVASKKPLEAGQVCRDDNLLACTYEPFVVGEHKIHVMFAGSEIPDSPFIFDSVPVGRADLCQIQGDVKSQVPIGEETAITVATADAGLGQLKCRVTQLVEGRPTNLPVEIEDNNDGTVSAYYAPAAPGPVQAELRFGGQLIPNGQITQHAVPPEQLDIVPKSVEATYNQVDFRLVVSGKEDQRIEGLVVRPSGVQDAVDLKENNDGTVTVNYKPAERGMHELHVSSAADGDKGTRMPLAGSPYKFFVDNTASGDVTAHGPGLSHGTTGQPAEFTVVMKDAGTGGLSVVIEGPSKAEITCQDNGDSTCHVTYYPMAPGEYVICLKFLDKNIPGSPFVAKITGEMKKRTQMNMSTTSCITFDVSANDISLLTATVVSPSGREEPCVLKQLPNNRMGISFTPKEYGEHLVNVFKAGQHIQSSPFRLNVSREDVGDPSKVRVTWPQNAPIMANQRNEFLVDSKDAGYATLSLSIEGPSKAEIECVDNSDGTCTVSFCPTEPGTYMVNVKYADEHVPGSPFTIQVGGEASQRLVQRIFRRREATESSQVGIKCGLTMRIADSDANNVTSEVVSPSGKRVPCELIPINHGQFTLRFVPQEVGVHFVSVLNRGVHIPGSPFQFTVGQPTDGGAGKVRVSGRGLEYGLVDERNEFCVYTREAGAGGLSIAIEGPSKAELFFEDQRDGSCVIYYRVRKPGEYICSIKFRDEHIPFSPFNIYISDPKEAARVSAYEIPVQYNQAAPQSGNDDLQVGRPVTFTVHCLDSEQLLVASVETPSKKQQEAAVHRLNGDQYVVRFIPREIGSHLIYVYEIPESDLRLGTKSPHRQHIDGSPFCIFVGDYTADPSTVYATGYGLIHGIVGQKNKFFVNTANAGTGVLSVLVDGPSKVQVTCEEREDGYEFIYVPTVPGEYKITIKYGGNFDIFGSPFCATVTGPAMGDMPEINGEQTSLFFRTANKTLQSHEYEVTEMLSNAIPQNVTSSGLGLKHSIIGKETQLHVDASKAGNAVLIAGMSGPKHPCDHFEVVHKGDNRFQITYKVEHEGRYILIVKWGDDHVPGSPFMVDAISPLK